MASVKKTKNKSFSLNSSGNADEPEITSAISSYLKNKASGKRFSNKDDQDVLNIYFKEMGEVSQMTAAQEADAWKKIDLCLQNMRKILYKFGFVYKEHFRILSSPEEYELSDIFPVDPGNPKENFIMDSVKRNEWNNEISLIYEKLSLQFSKDKRSKKMETLREEGTEILLKSPAMPVQLLEWHDVARRYLQMYKDNTIPAAELGEKTFCTPKEFESNVIAATALREEFEQWKLRMLETNLKLVINIVKKYKNRGLPFGDLIQEGNLGLMKALEKFNYKLGHRFCTYATWWIKHGCSRAISAQTRIIRLPVHMIKSIRQMQIAEQNYIQVNGKNPSDSDIAEILELPVERVRAIKKMSVQCLSLQAPVDENNPETTFEDLFADEQSDNPMRVYAKKMLRQRLNTALEQLSERQRQVISMRYGLDGGPCRSYGEVSEAFHITRERVRQIELKTLAKLRKHTNPQKYLDDFFL